MRQAAMNEDFMLAMQLKEQIKSISLLSAD